MIENCETYKKMLKMFLKSGSEGSMTMYVKPSETIRYFIWFLHQYDEELIFLGFLICLISQNQAASQLIFQEQYYIPIYTVYI